MIKELFSSYFLIDKFSSFLICFIGLFTVLTLFYSLKFLQGNKHIFRYFIYIFLTFIASVGVVCANNLVLLLIFWGFLGLTLYLLISLSYGEEASLAAKKTFIIIGASDSLMLLGIAIIYKLTGTFQINSISLALDNNLAIFAYICLAIGAFAKAGLMPFHSWIPDYAKNASTPVVAFLPASLDKLLGIYLLAKISLGIFQMTQAMNSFLMIMGSITIIAAAMMALVQQDLKRLLGYSTVSQVGYIVLGIGIGNPLGIAGGLFHMLNHAVYKSGLFLSGGSVEKNSGTTDLEKLGGYAKLLPISFVTFLIASLAGAGVPPFNGFASKWMIYQGIIEFGKNGGVLWIFCLAAALFGSALTLAAFMKVVHAVFLGQPCNQELRTKNQEPEAPMMWIPQAVLALLCIIFGVFAYQIPLKLFILPSVNYPAEFTFIGTWNAGLATILILTGIILGIIIYWIRIKPLSIREDGYYIGSEKLDEQPEVRFSGTGFYNTILEFGFLRRFYSLAQAKVFDLYEVLSKLVLGIGAMLRYIHNGVLSTYLTWCLLGMIVLLYLFIK